MPPIFRYGFQAPQNRLSENDLIRLAGIPYTNPRINNLIQATNGIQSYPAIDEFVSHVSNSASQYNHTDLINGVNESSQQTAVSGQQNIQNLITGVNESSHQLAVSGQQNIQDLITGVDQSSQRPTVAGQQNITNLITGVNESSQQPVVGQQSTTDLINQVSQSAQQRPPGDRQSIQDLIDSVNQSSEQQVQQQAQQQATQNNIGRYSQALGTLTRQNDGTYRRANDTSTYISQPDGSLYRVGGTYTPPGQAPVNLGNATLYFDGNVLRESNAPILPSTRPIQRLGLTPNGDGTYSMPGQGNTGRIYLQQNGTLYHEGGTMNGLVVTPGTYVVTNPATGEGEWRRDGANANPHNVYTHTPNIVLLGLQQNADGSFNKPGAGNTGNYLLQPDGSIFYEGGQVGGVNAQAQTYSNGQWNPAQNTRQAGTNLIQNLRLQPTRGARVFYCNHNGNNFYCYILPNGSLVWVRPNANEVQTSTNGTNWTTLNATQAQAPEIQQAVAAIRAVRGR